MDGSDAHNFNSYEQLVMGATGVAGIAAAQQSYFRLLHLKIDALKYFLTPLDDTRLDFEDIMHALRTISQKMFWERCEY